jgi:hypothetical protein
MQGSRYQGIMVQLIIDYVWYDTHACSMILESLIKLLGANQTRDGWNTWVTHLIKRIIKATLHGSRCLSLMSLGEAFPRFFLPFQTSVLPQPQPRLSLPLRLDQLDSSFWILLWV